MLALFDYPEGFNLSLRVNFVDGGEESEGFLFTGYTVSTFTEDMQKRYIAQYWQKYPVEHFEGVPPVGVEQFVAPKGYSDSYDHFHNFFNSVRTRKPVVEDAVCGFRAAGAALLSNLSLERGNAVNWSPNTMKLS